MFNLYPYFCLQFTNVCVEDLFYSKCLALYPYNSHRIQTRWWEEVQSPIMWGFFAFFSLSSWQLIYCFLVSQRVGRDMSSMNLCFRCLPSGGLWSRAAGTFWALKKFQFFFLHNCFCFCLAYRIDYSKNQTAYTLVHTLISIAFKIIHPLIPLVLMLCFARHMFWAPDEGNFIILAPYFDHTKPDTIWN